MHYANGREAKVGDLVVGKTYNTGERKIAGVLLAITPGPDSCSAEVGFLHVIAPDLVAMPERVVAIQGDSHHGAAGRHFATVYRHDSTHCANLLHVDDVVMEAAPQRGQPAAPPAECSVAHQDAPGGAADPVPAL